MKKIKLEMTQTQLMAMIDMANTISSMIGTGETFDDEQKKNLKLFDRMLSKNGYKRNFK